MMFCYESRRPWAGRARRLVVVIALAMMAAGCGEKAEKTDETAGGKPAQEAVIGDLSSFRLDNGITVYMREDHTEPQVAVEVLYRAGVIHEEKGHVHASRLLPHLMLFSATASFGPGEAADSFATFGRLNGEVVGEFTRFDYRAPPEYLDLILQIQSERMTSIRFSEDQLKLYAAKCAQDVEKNFQESNYALTKYGLMAFNQAYNYGLDDVPVYSGVRDLTIEDVERYRRANYRLSTMVLVIVGDFDTGHATKLVEKYFGSLESKPLELPKPTPADHDVTATWDIPADLIFEVYPGPYENQDERLVLTMFGNFLNRQLKADEILFEDVKATFCSGTIHPVGETPFFVFAQIRPLHDAEAVFPELLASIEQASGMVDEKVFDTMKINLAEYFESSLLESQRNLSTVPHYKILEQEAVNIAMKHYLRDGASTEEMIEKIHSIAYEDARRYLDSRLAEDSRRRVLIKGPGRAAGGQG